MTIEFHSLGFAGTKFTELLGVFSGKFYIALVHGNNYGKLIYNTKISETLELTFLNKKILPKEILLPQKQYPIEGLDAPCNKNCADYILNFND